MDNIIKQNIHIEPKKGWLNDPNGLIYENGVYHIHYQYSYDPKGGLKYWYKLESKDLINFKDLGVFINPDIEYDKDGVYSGTACKENEEIVYYYTGNVKEKGNYDYVHKGRGHNTIKYTKSKGKELIFETKEYPNMSNHVRDPKKYNEYLLLGARDKNDYGCLLIYKDFKYYKTVYPIKNLGYMWECPDYYKIDGKEIFMFSPQGIRNMYEENKNSYQVGYSIIHEGIENLEKIENFTLLDKGHDFYAPQTFNDENNDRVMIGWMSVPDSSYKNKELEYGYQHCLTIPRVLKLKNNKICQSIHKSILNLFDKDLSNNFNEKTWYFKTNSEFSIRIDDLEIKYEKNKLYIDIEKVGLGRDNREIVFDMENIEIIFDSSSFEIFANSGEIVFSSRFYPKSHNVEIKCSNYIAKKVNSIIIK